MPSKITFQNLYRNKYIIKEKRNREFITGRSDIQEVLKGVFSARRKMITHGNMEMKGIKRMKNLNMYININ